jgi:hypothetical protein
MFRLAHHVSPTLTVGHCIYKRWTIVLSCDTCERRADRVSREALARLPAGATIAEVASHVTCSGCGGKSGQLATMNWRSGTDDG